MGQSYFAEKPPAVEIRGGLVFLKPEGAHCEIAMAPHTLVEFVRAANGVLDEIYEHRSVVPIKAV